MIRGMTWSNLKRQYNFIQCRVKFMMNQFHFGHLWRGVNHKRLLLVVSPSTVTLMLSKDIVALILCTWYTKLIPELGGVRMKKKAYGHFNWSNIVNNVIWVSGVQHYNFISVDSIVCSPPKV